MVFSPLWLLIFLLKFNFPSGSIRGRRWGVSRFSGGCQDLVNFFPAVKGSNFLTNGNPKCPRTIMNQPTLKFSTQRMCSTRLFPVCMCSFSFPHSLQCFCGVHITLYQFWFPGSKAGIPKLGVWTSLWILCQLHFSGFDQNWRDLKLLLGMLYFFERPSSIH